MQTTLLQFSTGSDPIAWLIRERTFSWASHVDFLLPDGRLLGALPNGGVQIRPIGKYKHAIRLEVPIANGYQFALSQINKPYDWGAVIGLGMPFPRNWHSPAQWFCSELVAESLLRAGFPIVRELSDRITPRDLLLSPFLL